MQPSAAPAESLPDGQRICHTRGSAVRDVAKRLSAAGPLRKRNKTYAKPLSSRGAGAGIDLRRAWRTWCARGHRGL